MKQYILGRWLTIDDVSKYRLVDEKVIEKVTPTPNDALSKITKDILLFLCAQEEMEELSQLRQKKVGDVRTVMMVAGVDGTNVVGKLQRLAQTKQQQIEELQRDLPVISLEHPCDEAIIHGDGNDESTTMMIREIEDDELALFGREGGILDDEDEDEDEDTDEGGC